MARDLEPFVRFHAFANRRILETAAALNDEELRGPAPLDHGSAFDTLRHLVDVDWSWREFCTGNDVGQTYVWDHGVVLDDLPSITTFCAEEDGRLARYVRSLEPATLEERVRIGDEPEDSVPRWLILAHVVNHGTQHRSALARFLTDRGLRRATSTCSTASRCPRSRDLPAVPRARSVAAATHGRVASGGWTSS